MRALYRGAKSKQSKGREVQDHIEFLIQVRLVAWTLNVPPNSTDKDILFTLVTLTCWFDAGLLEGGRHALHAYLPQSCSCSDESASN